MSDPVYLLSPGSGAPLGSIAGFGWQEVTWGFGFYVPESRNLDFLLIYGQGSPKCGSPFPGWIGQWQVEQAQPDGVADMARGGGGATLGRPILRRDKDDDVLMLFLLR